MGVTDEKGDTGTCRRPGGHANRSSWGLKGSLQGQLAEITQSIDPNQSNNYDTLSMCGFLYVKCDAYIANMTKISFSRNGFIYKFID